MQKETQYQIKPNPTIQEDQYQEQEENKQQELIQNQKPKYKYYSPQFVTCKNYKNREEVVKAFPQLQSLNESENVDFLAKENAYSFILRSNNDDDIHKAIKYGIWCSTEPTNTKLQQLFIKAQEEKKDIYLFYSVVKSGQFVGVAQLTHNLKDEIFAYWWQSARWRGVFGIKWIFIKDIVYKKFDNLINSLSLPVIRSRDGTEVDWETTGKKMMQIFKEYQNDNNIFDDFEHMDNRESSIRFDQRNNGNYNQNYRHNHNNNYSYQNQQYNYYNQNKQFQMPQQMQMFNPMILQQMTQMIPQYYNQFMRMNNIYPPNQNQYDNQGAKQKQYPQQQGFQQKQGANQNKSNQQPEQQQQQQQTSEQQKE